MAGVVTRAGTLEIDDARAGFVERRVRLIVGQHYDFVWRSLRRLGIMTLLASRANPWAFQDLKVELEMSDGNLINGEANIPCIVYGALVETPKRFRSGRSRVNAIVSPFGDHAFG